MLTPRILDSRACGFDVGPALPRLQDLVAAPGAEVGDSELEAAVKHDMAPRGYDYETAAGLIHYEEFHPYGTTAYRAGDSGIDVSPRRYRYTGMEQDEETGLGYHTARYYAGWLGRWTSSDPIGLGGGVNRFGYVEGRVGGNSDASGLAEPDLAAAQREWTRIKGQAADAFKDRFAARGAGTMGAGKRNTDATGKAAPSPGPSPGQQAMNLWVEAESAVVDTLADGAELLQSATTAASTKIRDVRSGARKIYPLARLNPPQRLVRRRRRWRAAA